MTYTVTPENAGISILQFFRLRLKLSVTAVRRLKYRERGITVNGNEVTVRFILHEGDVIVLDESDTEQGTLIASDLPVNIVYSDGIITVCDKPPFMPTHPVHGHLDDTLANALAYRSGDPGFVFRPMNRLDRNTSGLVVTADNFLASGSLGAQMKKGQVHKTYLAIVCGVPENRHGVVDAPIIRSDPGVLMRTVGSGGDEALTVYDVISVSHDGKLSLVRLRPQTGRTHQIRVHMAHIGCPLLGDFMYGQESPLISRHALHACGIIFRHPSDGRIMDIRSPLPADMAAVLGSEFL